MSAETGRKKGSNEVVPSNGWEPAPLPRTGGAPERTGANIKRYVNIVNAARRRERICSAISISPCRARRSATVLPTRHGSKWHEAENSAAHQLRQLSGGGSAVVLAGSEPVLNCVQPLECSVEAEAEPQHFLNFLPEPQGHDSLRPTFTDRSG